MTSPASAPSLGDAVFTLERFAHTLFHPDPLTRMIEIVVGLLALGSIVVFVARRHVSESAARELILRVRSWWVMAALCVPAIIVDWRVSILFFAILSFLALREFYTLVGMRAADQRAMLLSYLAIGVQYWWVYTQWYIMFLIFVPVYMFVIVPLRLVITGDTQRFVNSIGRLHWGLMAFVYGLSYLAYLLVMDHRGQTEFEAGNRGLLLYLIFLAEFNDVLQFVFGKTLGRHKLAPTVSPNKTWEGFLGGLICTSALAVALRFLTPMDSWHALGAGALIGLTGPAGGLVISAIKRDAGAKDSGTLIPGHGGILDRVDSLCFSAPVFFHYVGYYY